DLCPVIIIESMTHCWQLYAAILIIAQNRTRVYHGATMTFERYGQIFRHRSFRLFWGGFTFSVLGDTMSRVALTWFVYETTRSAEALGWLMLCYTGPVVVGGLVAGPLLDRFDRRAVMGA